MVCNYAVEDQMEDGWRSFGGREMVMSSTSGKHKTDELCKLYRYITSRLGNVTKKKAKSIVFVALLHRQMRLNSFSLNQM